MGEVGLVGIIWPIYCAGKAKPIRVLWISKMKNENPHCPECGWSKTKKNGVSDPLGTYPKQRFRCKRCETEVPVPMNAEMMRLRPIDKLRLQDRKAIQFNLLGCPWADIQVHTGVKQRTVKKKLREIFKNGLFGELQARLLEEFSNLDEDNFVALQKTLEADAKGEPAFRRAGQVVGK